MKLQWPLSFKNRDTQTLTDMKHPTFGWLSSLLTNTKFDYQGKVGDAQDASVFMAPLMWIARNSIQARIEVTEITPDGDVAQPDHPLVKLLNKPNPVYSGKQLQKGTIISMRTSRKDAYWIIVRDNVDEPAELWLAPSHLITPMNFPGNEGAAITDYYSYQPGGVGEVRLNPRDVVHIRDGVNPRDVRFGMSTIYPVLREVYSDMESANFTGALLNNMGIPGIIISPKDKETTITDPKAMKEKYKDEYGNDKRGAVMVMSQPLDIHQLAFDPDKMSLDKIRNLSEERACAMLGVQPSVIGFGTGLNQTKVGATAKENRASSWEDGIIPTLDDLADAIEFQLLPEYEENFEQFLVGYNTSRVPALQESLDAKFKRATLGVNGQFLTVTQAQIMTGQEPDDSQNVYLRRSTTVEVPANEKSRSKMYGRRVLLKNLKQDTTGRMIARFVADQRELGPSFQRDLTPFLSKAAGLVADAYVAVTGPKQLQGESRVIVDQVDMAALELELQSIYGKYYGEVLDTTVTSINGVLGAAVNMPDPVAAEIVAVGGRRAGLIDLPRTTRDRLFKILAQAQEDGVGADEIVRRIRGTVTAGPWSTIDMRARVIARTETLHAQRTSQLATYNQMDPNAPVQVFDALLGDTDEDCEAVNGAVVSQQEAETLAAEEHPNGTRGFVIVQ